MTLARPCQWRCASRGQRGLATLIVLLFLPAMLWMLGMAVDASQMFLQRRQVQTAADMAALAATFQILREQAGTVVAAGLSDAAANGFTGDATTTVDISSPPASGAYMGVDLHSQATVARDVDLLFLHMLGLGNPRVQATATAVGRRSSCIFQIDPSSNTSAMSLSNSAMIQAPDCNVQVNSLAANALALAKSAALAAHSVRVRGNVSLGNGAAVTPAPVTGAPLLGDPLADLPEPLPDTCIATSLVVATPVTLSPGTYCGGITANSGADITLLPGLYILYGGGLSFRANTRIQGQGVTIFNTFASTPKLLQHGSIQMNAGTVAGLSAPGSGAYAGILFFETRSAPLNIYWHMFTGPATNSLVGAIYLPKSALQFLGAYSGCANSASPHLSLIASTVHVSGCLRVNFSNRLAAPDTRQMVRLVE